MTGDDEGTPGTIVDPTLAKVARQVLATAAEAGVSPKTEAVIHRTLEQIQADLAGAPTKAAEGDPPQPDSQKVTDPES